MHGRPGDGWGADPEAVVPVGPTVDHSTLLRNQEFAGIVIRKLSNTSDVLLTIGSFSEAMNELIWATLIRSWRTLHEVQS